MHPTLSLLSVMPINTNTVTIGQVTGKTGTVTFRPFVPSKKPFRPNAIGKGVRPHITSQNVSGKTTGNTVGKRPVGGKRPMGGIKKKGGKRKMSRNTMALREIRAATRNTCLIIAPTQALRLIKEAFANMQQSDMRVSRGYKADFNMSVESFILEVLEKAQACCVHAKRTTLTDKDILCALYILGQVNGNKVGKVAF